MLSEKAIRALEAQGFKRWTRDDMDRLYINAETALDFDYDTNKSGHVSGAYLNGERISNTRGEALRSSKTYIDVRTGELISDHDMVREAAEALYDEVRWAEEHREELEAAQAAGSMFPACEIARYCRENEVVPPADMEATIKRLDAEYQKRLKMPAYSSNGWAATCYAILDDWKLGKI